MLADHRRYRGQGRGRRHFRLRQRGLRHGLRQASRHVAIVAEQVSRREKVENRTGNVGLNIDKQERTIVEL